VDARDALDTSRVFSWIGSAVRTGVELREA
jgi:hypothetical protein